MLGQIVGKLVVIINFELNKEYIVKNLCEQKEEEDNCCQGSCHLKKELEKQEEQAPSPNTQQKIKLSEDQCCNNLFLFNGNSFLENQVNTPIAFCKSSAYKASIFHPPNFIS